MNFWEFKEDHLKGYYLPVNNEPYKQQGRRLVYFLFFLFISLLKLTGSILFHMAILVLTAVRFLIYSRRKFPWKNHQGN